MTLKEYLKGAVGNTSIPLHYEAEIATYKRVDSNDYKGRKWYKVYYTGYDSKYGAFMVSPETEEWRDTTMLEFYGGAVVD